MSKSIFERIDDEEEKRLDAIEEELDSEKEVSPAEILGNENLAKMLNDKPLLFLDSLHGSSPELPSKCLINSKILGFVCPKCDFAKKPELLKPYLERELIIPVLGSHLADYKKSFSEMIIEYPYIGSGTVEFLRNDLILSSPDGNAMCPHCFKKRCNQVLKKIDSVIKNQEVNQTIKGHLKKSVFPYLSSYSLSQMKILDEMEKTIIEAKFERFDLLEKQLYVLNNIRYAQTFNACVQINRDDLKSINDHLSKSEFDLSKLSTDFDEKKWAIEALHIDYDPKMPIIDYLDIIKDRQKKVTTLLTNLLYNERGKPVDISHVANKIANINHELVSSKSMELFTCSTSFLRNNSGVITSMLLGGLIGYSSANFLGCTLGSATGLLGSIGAKLLSKEINFNVPESPKNTLEWLKSKVEDSEEKITASLLAKDIEIIQIWNLRKKLKTV
jgi:hypothetical protein